MLLALEAASAEPAGGLAAVLQAELSRACSLCDGSLPPPVALTTSEVLARARELAAANADEIARLNGRWRSGEFGPPGTREARERVHRLARAQLRNWYAYFLPLVAASEVRALEPGAMAELSARYCESGVFPVPRLCELRIGQGRVCARYDLDGELEQGVTLLGGKRVPYRVHEQRVSGRRRRLLSIEWRSHGIGEVEVLFADHYGFRLEQMNQADAAGRYVLWTARDVSGAWVRRWGIHRPGAFAFWTVSAGEQRPPEARVLPTATRVGSVLWLPRLSLQLPLLPDIPVGDLRQLGLPLPFLPVDHLRRGALPEWLPVDGAAGLEGWSGLGDVPEAVRELFPDR